MIVPSNLTAKQMRARRLRRVTATSLLALCVAISPVALDFGSPDVLQVAHADSCFVGGIAHDFNNLLGVVLGNLDLIALDPKKDARQMALLRRAIEAAERGASLTHRLLAFSRRQTLITSETDINELVAGLSDMLRRTLGEAVGSRFDRPPIYGARSSIQISSKTPSLTSRSTRATPCQAAVSSRLRLEIPQFVRCSISRGAEISAGDYVMIAVADTGTGMPADVIERAFEPFFTTKGVGEGTGLGLSMVYGFVKQSGGHVEIDSAEGLGTTVKLYLPRAIGRPSVKTAETQRAEAV